LATAPLTTTNYILKATGTTIGNSLIWDNGTNVGIGNTNTSYTLDVSGSLRSTNTAYFATTSGVVGIGTTSVNASTILAVAGSNTVTDARGMVSVNSTNASAADLGGSISLGGENGLGTSPYAFAKISGRKEGAGATYSGYLSLATTFSDGTITERMRITSTGNIGIGTTSPTAIMQIQGAQSGVSGKNLTISYNGTYYAEYTEKSITAFNNELIFGTGTGGAERMRITGGGDVCMGATSSLASARLTVVKSTSDYVMYVENTNATSGDKTYRSILGANTNNTNSFHFSANAAGGDRIYIYGNGNIVNSNNSYGPISDIKLKENIVDATPKLDKLMQVRIVNYNLIDTPELKQIGVIAQELEQVFPALIDEHPDYDLEGNNLGTTTKSVKMSVFVPMLIKAMQEQNQIINNLKERIVNLESK
jgi:hypothetical protein